MLIGERLHDTFEIYLAFRGQIAFSDLPREKKNKLLDQIEKLYFDWDQNYRKRPWNEPSENYEDPNWNLIDFPFDYDAMWAEVNKDNDFVWKEESQESLTDNHCSNCSVDKQFLDSRYKDCLEAQELTYQDNIQILVPAVKIDLTPTKLRQITNRIMQFLKDFQNHSKPKTQQNQFNLITKFTCLLNAIYEINKHKHLEEFKNEK